MTWRGLVAVLLLAALGVAGGVGVAAWTADEPAVIHDATPVAAQDPEVPTDPPVDVLPDPTTPPLDPDVRTHTEKIGQDPFALRLPVPNGWDRSDSRPGVWTWIVVDNPDNTYLLRVSLPAGFSTIGDALDDRIGALEGATGIQEFTLEDRTADTFVATYVLDGHLRVAMERFLSLDGTQTVYAQVALVGRDTDREGMTALLDKISAEATR